ncbi:hypothetical protein FOZ62_008695, partial [Perkinsus olseni]
MFWAEKIVPGKPTEISSEALEGATLELLSVVLSGSHHKAQLLVSTDGEEKFMVARLSDAHPNVQLGLEFEEDVTFYAEGGEITISGSIVLPEGMEEDEEEEDSDLDENIEGPIPVAMESEDEESEDEEEEEEEEAGKIEEITEKPIAGPKKTAVEEKKPQQKSPAKKTPEKKSEVKEVQKTIEKKEEP